MDKDEFMRITSGKFNVEYVVGKLDKTNKLHRFLPEANRFEPYKPTSSRVLIEKAPNISLFKIYKSQDGMDMGESSGSSKIGTVAEIRVPTIEAISNGQSSSSGVLGKRPRMELQPDRSMEGLDQQEDQSVIDIDLDEESGDEEPEESTEQGLSQVPLEVENLPECQMSFQDEVAKLNQLKKVANQSSGKLTTPQVTQPNIGINPSMPAVKTTPATVKRVPNKKSRY